MSTMTQEQEVTQNAAISTAAKNDGLFHARRILRQFYKERRTPDVTKKVPKGRLASLEMDNIMEVMSEVFTAADCGVEDVRKLSAEVDRKPVKEEVKREIRMFLWGDPNPIND